jgi:hypothetical protein
MQLGIGNGAGSSGSEFISNFSVSPFPAGGPTSFSLGMLCSSICLSVSGCSYVPLFSLSKLTPKLQCDGESKLNIALLRTPRLDAGLGGAALALGVHRSVFCIFLPSLDLLS